MSAETPAIDAAHLARQREWSRDTFGPGARLLGVLDHTPSVLVAYGEHDADILARSPHLGHYVKNRWPR